MSIELQIEPEFEASTPAEKIAQAAAAAVAEILSDLNIGMTIVITTDEQLQKLNLEYLEIDAPTDVLSFPADEIDPDTGERYLGDILISLPKAQRQAEQGGHTLAEELQLLTVHGTLHLNGYDHLEETDKAEMWAVQAKILAAIGCSLSPP